VINGFASDGIILSGSGGNTIAGNYIGTDATGTAAVANSVGVSIGDSGSNNLIGGAEPGAGNLISGNNSSGIILIAGGGNLVQGNRIGTDVGGVAALGNGRDGVTVNAGGNTIGGSAEGAGNLISGNRRAGILVNSNTGTIVAGNRIGTDTAGTSPVPNLLGVSVTGSTNTLVGGIEPGAGNLISGNVEAGVEIFGGDGGNCVQGNRIGTDETGAAPLGNQIGVQIFGGSTLNNIIGGSGAGNLISGNRGEGVAVNSPRNTVQANFIGTDVSGTRAVPNDIGVSLGEGGNLIGGVAPGDENLVSGNRSYGVFISGGRNNLVQGNRVGTDVSGTVALGNGEGVFINTGSGNTIGGVVAGAGNLISGNRLNGVTILDSGNRVQGNLVGTDISGTTAVANGRSGVLIDFVLASGNLIGGADAGAGNTIAFNGGAGVVVQGAGATGNRIQGNAIHSNAGLGIDLGGDGVTPNDPGDADSGPNQLQNFPVLCVALAGATTRVAGTVNSLANTTFTLDFYASAEADPSGFGEGERYLGSALVTTDGSGDARFEVTLAAPTTPGEAVTATATDPAGNTSEFPGAVLADTGGAPWRGTDSVQVVRGGDGAGSVAGAGGFDGLLLTALGTPAAPPEGRAFRPGLPVAGQKDEPASAPPAMPAPGDAGADMPPMLVPDTMRRASAQASPTAWLDLVFADFPGEDRLLDGAVGPTVS
jgi:titin